jgi:transcriptional regulator with XRE-family HTH domain
MGPNNPGIREDGLREVREIRLRRGLSQADLSAMTGVAEFTISGIESGKRANPRPSTLRKLAQALEVEVADLYGDPENPLAEALPLQDRLFNGGAKERGAFIERCRRHVAARVAHYENRLAVAKNGGLYAGYKGAKDLQDDAYEEFSQLRDSQNDELIERWLDDPEVPEDVKEDLGFALVEAQKPFVRIVGRIGDRVSELAETQAEKDEAEQEKERRREEMREATRRIERERRTA